MRCLRIIESKIWTLDSFYTNYWMCMSYRSTMIHCFSCGGWFLPCHPAWNHSLWSIIIKTSSEECSTATNRYLAAVTSTPHTQLQDLAVREKYFQQVRTLILYMHLHINPWLGIFLLPPYRFILNECVYIHTCTQMQELLNSTTTE